MTVQSTDEWQMFHLQPREDPDVIELVLVYIY